MLNTGTQTSWPYNQICLRKPSRVKLDVKRSRWQLKRHYLDYALEELCGRSLCLALVLESLTLPVHPESIKPPSSIKLDIKRSKWQAKPHYLDYTLEEPCGRSLCLALVLESLNPTSISHTTSLYHVSSWTLNVAEPEENSTDRQRSPMSMGIPFWRSLMKTYKTDTVFRFW